MLTPITKNKAKQNKTNKTKQTKTKHKKQKTKNILAILWQEMDILAVCTKWAFLFIYTSGMFYFSQNTDFTYWHICIAFALYVCYACCLQLPAILHSDIFYTIEK